MGMTMICADTREQANPGNRVHAVEPTSTDKPDDGVLDATCPIERTDPGIAGGLAINGSHTLWGAA